MRKTLNTFSLALWIVAAIYVVAEAWALYDITQLRAHAGIAPSPPAIWDGFRAIVMDSVILVSFGVLIELVDRIRWHIERRDRKDS
jgi:hypothetical protein